MPSARPLPHGVGTLTLGARTLVMGIVNVTPDSFSDGGVHARAEDAVAGARRMAAEGADILDIGGESTRPGHVSVAAEDEWAPGRAGAGGAVALRNRPAAGIDRHLEGRRSAPRRGGGRVDRQ